MIVFPNAKINIGLFVTEKRKDGFHNLETVFYPIGLSDVLEVGRGEGKAGEYCLVNTGIEVACEPEKNLIVKAYLLLAGLYDLPSVSIHLHKVIPFGAGLGGGSSDAAFMLRALNDYFELHISEEKELEYAASLGSDCAFFIRNHPAFASGRGEVLEEMELSLGDYQLVLVKPDFEISTAEAYAGISPQLPVFDLRGLGALSPMEWRGKVENDFEKNVFEKYPRLAALKQQLYDGGAVYASMTGSGSAVYGLFERSKECHLKWEDCFVWQTEMI
ncbi:MAG: 4-(cytidine 5'-diphospho)-2-C-methyl-D-erythritol kinase [Odoribacter sp.]